MRLHFSQVMAGAERRSGARQHHDAGAIVMGDRVKFHDQGLDHGKAQGIEIARRVQGQGENAMVIIASEKPGRRGDGRRCSHELFSFG